MIKVLIVEDEPPIARVLAKLIEKNENFKVIAIEYDGKSALSRIESEPVDVIFTDIRLPVMDGLKLLSEINNRFPNILRVIFTGYQDFEYAKEAISYHVFDYLLKPLTTAKIDNILSKILEKYREVTKEINRIQIQRFLAGEDRTVNCHETCFFVTVCAGALAPLNSPGSIPGQDFWSSYNLEKMLNKASDHDGTFLVFNGIYKAEKIIVMQYINETRAKDILQDVYTQLCSSHIPITMIGHSSSIFLSDIYAYTRKLYKVLGQTLRIYISQFVWDDINTRPPPSRSKIFMYQEELVQGVCKGDINAIKITHDKIISSSNGIPQYELMDMIEQVLTDERVGIGKYTFDPASVLKCVEKAIVSAYNNKLLWEDMLKLIENTSSDPKSPIQVTINEIEQYLITNYNKPVSHEMLAAKFGYVPTYLSKMFRKHKGVSPSEFLTAYRISKAKEFMISRPDVRIKEIAEAVGYANPYYFSKTFKKTTGMWPKDFVESVTK